MITRVLARINALREPHKGVILQSAAGEELWVEYSMRMDKDTYAVKYR